MTFLGDDLEDEDLLLRLTCPTCGMSASLADERQFRPLRDDPDHRWCRNCGDDVEIRHATSSPNAISDPVTNADRATAESSTA